MELRRKGGVGAPTAPPRAGTSPLRGWRVEARHGPRACAARLQERGRCAARIRCPGLQEWGKRGDTTEPAYWGRQDALQCLVYAPSDGGVLRFVLMKKKG